MAIIDSGSMQQKINQLQGLKNLEPLYKWRDQVDTILTDVKDTLYDVSGSGGGGGGTTELEHGTQIMQIPGIDIGIEPSSGQTTPSWNNDLAAYRFDHYGEGLAESDHPIIRTPIPQITGYTGGDVTFRVHYSLTNSGEAGDAAVFRLGFDQYDQGEELNSDYANFYSNTVDLENISFDTMQQFDFTITGSVWDVTKSRTFIQLERQITDAADTFSGSTQGDLDHRVYVHGFSVIWTGWGVPASMSAPE